MKTIALPSLPLETQTYQSSVDEMGTQLIDNQWLTGLSIGLIHPDGIEFYNYGVQDTVHQTPVSRNSIYEIGSVTKVFNSTLLAHLTIDSTITLDQPCKVGSFKIGSTHKRRCANLSTSLSTHTSGLPRLQLTLPRPI